MPISKEIILKNMREKRVVVLNVLAPAEFQKLHIAGSYSLSLTHDYSGFVQEVKRKFGGDRVFVTYGSDYTNAIASNAAKILRNNGVKAEDFLGGMKEWNEAGFPVLGTQVKDKASI